MITDALSMLGEEAMGTLCGLPPGTVTAAKAMGVGLAASSTSDTVEQRTSGLSSEEKKVVATAVNNVAVTAQRDNPDWSRRKAERFAMGMLVAARKLYSGEAFKQALCDAVSANRSRHHRLIANVASAAR